MTVGDRPGTMDWFKIGLNMSASKPYDRDAAELDTSARLNSESETSVLCYHLASYAPFALQVLS